MASSFVLLRMRWPAVCLMPVAVRLRVRLMMISLFSILKASSTLPWLQPCLRRAFPERWLRMTPKMENSMARRMVDLPDPMSPERRREPSGKSILSFV